MRYLLDTNICIYWLKGVQSICNKVVSIKTDDLAISAITIAELLYGAYNSPNIEKNLAKVKDFEEAIEVLGFDRKCFESYAQAKANLKSQGKMVDDFDILIAATALVNDCVLVTNNIRHFERFEGLKLENWLEK